MKAVQEELERAAITIELESGEGTFNVQGAGSDKITITVTIESHAVTGNMEQDLDGEKIEYLRKRKSINPSLRSCLNRLFSVETLM